MASDQRPAQDRSQAESPVQGPAQGSARSSAQDPVRGSLQGPAGGFAQDLATNPAQGAAPPAPEDGHPPADQGDDPRSTLLWTAATARPVDEVASLVSLLKQTDDPAQSEDAGTTPSPGDEALRAAAVTRSVDDVHELVTLLNQPPHATAEAHTALRAAAVERPIEDVAELIDAFATEAGAEAGAETGVGGERPDSGPTAGPGAGSVPVSVAVAAPDRVRAAGRPLTTVPDAVSVRSALRWPTAAALFVIGAIHLPVHVPGLRSSDYATGTSLAAAAVCLLLAVLLAAQDAVWIWVASGTAAVGTIVVHSLAVAFSRVDLLRNSLGHSFTGAATAAMTCAVVAAVLAGSALLHPRQPAASAASAPGAKSGSVAKPPAGAKSA